MVAYVCVYADESQPVRKATQRGLREAEQQGGDYEQQEKCVTRISKMVTPCIKTRTASDEAKRGVMREAKEHDMDS